MRNQALTFDICVIGAGPGGSSAAKSAAREGRQVALIERRPDVSTPIRCGEGIGFKGFDKSLGVQKKWVLSEVTSVRLVSPSGTMVTLKAVDKSYVVDRSKMDSDLVIEAIETGATFVKSTTIVSVMRTDDGWYECASSDRVFRSRCVVLADGVESRLARQAGWNTALKLDDVETCAFARVCHPTIEPNVIEMRVGKSYAPGGYVWVFPRGSGVANVGLGVLGTLHRPGMARDLLMQFISNHFPGAQISHVHCGGVPVAKGVRPLVRNGVLLVGDAARQVHALAGAGLAYSVIAGRMAGEVAARAFDANGFHQERLREYDRLWFKHYGKQQKRSHALKTTVTGFSDRFLDEIAQSLSRQDPDRINLLKLFMQTFARHPWQLFKVLKLYR